MGRMAIHDFQNPSSVLKPYKAPQPLCLYKCWAVVKPWKLQLKTGLFSGEGEPSFQKGGSMYLVFSLLKITMNNLLCNKNL